MNRSLQWDIFCKVIDNFGDIGVCWRLASDLGARGHKVRLWIDDSSALRWMAPGGSEGVQVLPWDAAGSLSLDVVERHPPDVMVEAFGCAVAPEFIAACAGIDWAAGQKGLKPCWINLEYLSAENYVERCHAMPSLVHSGPAAGWTKWFFYPGFTRLTGGLLREPDLMARQAGFDRRAWLAGQGIAPDNNRPEKLVSLFCYEPPALGALLNQLARHGLQGEPVRLLVTAGRAAHAVKAALDDQNALQPNHSLRGLLSISYLDLLTQQDFDHLLWACDLNLVRGEDSLVRALWAGHPLVWQIYPQADNAHLAKLDAFLDAIKAPPSLRRFHAAWNSPGHELPAPDLPAWSACLQAARQGLLDQGDLTTQLMAFVVQNQRHIP
ncbi:MAG: hypothetical protein B7X59_08670 [Polaromonas sp. 39-63-203]|jgi:uncharacterized repeat protein (TIGR03837 family)|uniref:elongation factor P maturation arginine rhamnosyltransferase EarP n=1 Tax=Polaromonas sp. TaxID=1869339 RepID=UPI000BD16A53|nr:elongation factor P maturation arginine rhamnosyltransferase EarP [Polaromonas sp.]OYY52103.1 MAG: hypothetical protein B7Y54_08105 [Polaromonas sp. 35-63-240]OYY91281.1 MAG: hypothetical protein B7Y42_13315 [Polaromonas sp. 28-63-22]OYZ83368.1 MAG: hypothetical protein B7Y03_09570 [Polaromonas sp. 24-62-144]OZA97016.1 MAG: hypothetical protein B7X59_08670 [Polaromonas sp. 39-63-203]HQS31692.1 elongation factor P maturation arginine rhamnosyltransferase EarP [Polaromonas sp.]